jgi:hypothetical protein
MKRIGFALLLSTVLISMGLMSGGFGDSSCTFETWMCSFLLPIWSLFSISLWHDVGRLLWVKTFKIDTEDSKVSYDLRSLIFILWMSVVFTYVIWIHISLFAIPLLFVIPFLGIPFSNLMIQDWSVKPSFTHKQILTLAFWASTSYLIYWGLTIIWILFRVWLLDSFEDGIVYFIQ